MLGLCWTVVPNFFVLSIAIILAVRWVEHQSLIMNYFFIAVVWIQIHDDM